MSTALFISDSQVYAEKDIKIAPNTYKSLCILLNEIFKVLAINQMLFI